MKNFIMILPLSLFVFTVPAYASWGKKDKDVDAIQQQQQTQQYVDAKMHETLSSIDKSLSTLVSLSRGGEPSRKSGPIGATVAGAYGVNKSPVKPDVLPVDTKVLDKKVQIQWNGSADELLKTLAQQIGYRYDNNGKPLNKRILVESDSLPLKNVLDIIASQINGEANIKISLTSQTLSLIR